MPKRKLTEKELQRLKNLFPKPADDLGELLPKYVLLRERFYDLAQYIIESGGLSPEAEHALISLESLFRSTWRDVFNKKGVIHEAGNA